MRIPIWRGLLVASLWLVWPVLLLAAIVPLRWHCDGVGDCYYIPPRAEWRLFLAAWLLPAGIATVAWLRGRAK